MHAHGPHSAHKSAATSECMYLVMQHYIIYRSCSNKYAHTHTYDITNCLHFRRAVVLTFPAGPPGARARFKDRKTPLAMVPCAHQGIDSVYTAKLTICASNCACQNNNTPLVTTYLMVQIVNVFLFTHNAHANKNQTECVVKMQCINNSPPPVFVCMREWWLALMFNWNWKSFSACCPHMLTLQHSHKMCAYEMIFWGGRMWSDYFTIHRQATFVRVSGLCQQARKETVLFVRFVFDWWPYTMLLINRECFFVELFNYVSLKSYILNISCIPNEMYNSFLLSHFQT